MVGLINACHNRALLAIGPIKMYGQLNNIVLYQKNNSIKEVKKKKNK